jgi:hypothetical protein
MKKFIENNFVIIVLVITLLTLFKSCGDSRELTKVRQEITVIKDSTYTKQELNIELQISGLEAEKRMIQATDRKLFDVRRQTEIEDEIKKLKSQRNIEIAALSALAAISAQMGSKVYFPFGIVTLIQFIGNIFFAYQYIDINSVSFKDWVDLVDPFVSYLGVESGDLIGHKRFLSLFAGGMLPIISLSFLHMLVKFEEEEKKKTPTPQPQVLDIDQLSIQAGKMEAEVDKEKYTPTQEELEKLENELRKLNEQKFGVLENELQEESNSDSEVKRLSYLRSHG